MFVKDDFVLPNASSFNIIYEIDINGIFSLNIPRPLCISITNDKVVIHQEEKNGRTLI